MTNHDRYWESAIAEAASGRQPPDQSAEILARLNAPPVRGWAARRWPVRMAVHAGQTAIAAGVLLAIGLATGVVQWPGPDSPPISAPIKRDLIATPGAKWLDHEGYVDLGQGALLLSTGAPEVRRGDSSFSQLDGLALLATGEPDKQQMAEWQTWMQTKGVEADMIKNATRWITSTALCVLMLQGSATLDGQKVEAEKPPDPTWHKVDSIMALEKLPPEAKYIQTTGLNGTYLPIIATTSRLEGLRFLEGRSMTTEHVEALAGMPNLRVLDLRGCFWTDGPEYAPIARIPKLERAGLDLFIPNRKKDEDRAEAELRENELAAKQIAAFREFAGKGLKIDFSVGSNASRFAGQLAEVFPDCEDITLHLVNDDTCRHLIKFSKLKRLTIKWLAATEPGYAWLGKLSMLETLDIACSAFDATYAYHLAKIKTLRVLRMSNRGQSGNWPQGSLTGLCAMEQLRELRIDNYTAWSQIAAMDGQLESPFLKLKNLELFAADVSGEYIGDQYQGIRHHFDIGFLVGAKTIALNVMYPAMRRGKAPADTPASGSADLAAKLECLRLYLSASGEVKVTDYLDSWAATFKRYPNLKRIEIGKYGDYSGGHFWAGPKIVDELGKALPGITVVEVD